MLLAVLSGCTPPAQEAAPSPRALRPSPPAAITPSADPWVLATERPDERYRGAYLGNGLIGQRFDEGGGALRGEATPADSAFLAGHYDTAETLQPIPAPLAVRIAVGGELLGSTANSVKRYRQELRLREGLLSTRATVAVPGGEVVVALEAALLRQEPRRALLLMEVENRGGRAVGLEAPHADLASPTAAGATVRRVLLPLEGAASAGDGVEIAPGTRGTAALVATVTPAGAPALPLPTPQSVAEWRSGHLAAWERLWASDVEIEGDAEAQEVVRTCRFWLLCSMREDVSAGVPPMGLSANSFGGHVFWDMDSWMLPAVLPQHPELSRAMLEYRRSTLAGAQANARSEGLPGASYAWESARSGKETLRDAVFRHGRHVTGDVALAAQQYYRATGDRGFLAAFWPVLQQTADNWVARARPDGSGGLAVFGVTTPDENAGQVDHSAWTHHVARVNLELAGEAGRILGRRGNPRWSETARGLGFLRSEETGLILPYAGFGERSRAKQADVLLLLFPGELKLPVEEQGRMYDYYAPRVIETGPAMTDAIHAVIAARLGRAEEAEQRFRAAYRPFLRPPFHLFSEKRTRDNLCFLTGAAGVLEAVLYGFAGLHLEPDPQQPGRPRLEPHLPAGWNRLTVRNLRWRGAAWDVEIAPGSPPRWTPRVQSASR